MWNSSESRKSYLWQVPYNMPVYATASHLHYNSIDTYTDQKLLSQGAIAKKTAELSGASEQLRTLKDQLEENSVC